MQKNQVVLKEYINKLTKLNLIQILKLYSIAVNA